MASVSLSATGKASFDELSKQMDANDGDAWKAARSTARVVGHNVGKAVAVAAAAAACGTVGSVVPGIGTAIGALACGYLAGVLADFCDEVLGPIVDDAVDAIGEFFGFTSEPPKPSHIYVIPSVGTTDFALKNSVLLLQRAHHRMGLPGPYSTLDVLRRLKQTHKLPLEPRSTKDTPLGPNSLDFSNAGQCTWSVPKDLIASAVSVTACRAPLPVAHALPSALSWAPDFSKQFENGRWMNDSTLATGLRANLRHAADNKRRFQREGRTSAEYDGRDAWTWRQAARFRATVMKRWLETLQQAYAAELLALETMATTLAADKATEDFMERLTSGLRPYQQAAAAACLRRKTASQNMEHMSDSAREQAMTRIIAECRAEASHARPPSPAAAVAPPRRTTVTSTAREAVRLSPRQRELLERARGKRPTTMADLERVEAASKGIPTWAWWGVAAVAGGYLVYKHAQKR